MNWTRTGNLKIVLTRDEYADLWRSMQPSDIQNQIADLLDKQTSGTTKIEMGLE